MLANRSTDFSTRLREVIEAIKLVYASTWFEGPRAFSKAVGQRRQDSMAVILQQVAGSQYQQYFYPAISGVALSYNYYPVPPMQSEDGIAHLALGFGKTVVEGKQSLRFSPAFPKHLPQFSTVDDMLANTQRNFYCMDMAAPASLHHETSNLILRTIDNADNEYPVRYLSSTYIPEEHRVRDGNFPGPKVISFAPILKYGSYPLPEILKQLLAQGREGMGCEVEIEFAVDIADASQSPVFYFLQLRPIVSDENNQEIHITRQEKEQAFLYATHALGHGYFRHIHDIIFVDPKRFDRTCTTEIAQEISLCNKKLHNHKRPYLLIGPGRWGTADRWLGIPVQWGDISGVAAIVEVQDGSIPAEASQGTHFFQNITSLGIPYMMTTTKNQHSLQSINWTWLLSLDTSFQGTYITHVTLPHPIHLKVDGTQAEAAAWYP